MPDLMQDASLASKQAQDSELVALKQQVDRLKGDLTPGQNGKQKLRKACTNFEAVFISKMWEQMRATVPKGGMLSSPQEDMYRSMFDRDFAEKLASDGGFGLGDMLYNQLQGKIKDAGKTPGPLGSIGLQSAKTAAAATPTTADAAAKTVVPATPSPTSSASAALNATGAAATGQLSTTTFTAPKRPMGSVAPASASAAAPAATAPTRPASVPGEVMADVDALARRIEADYDRRQTQTQTQSPASTGQVSEAEGSASGAPARGRASGYGLKGSQGGVGAGRIFAKVG